MSGSNEKQVTVKVKQTRKKVGQTKVESRNEEKAEFEEEGMSKAWQGFYKRVKQAVEE